MNASQRAGARAEVWRERVRNYKRAFEDGAPLAGRWWARLGARLGIARLARFVLADQTWQALVLADLERFCHAGREQTTHVHDDPTGRDSAQLEGRRQVYLRIVGYVALTPAEILAVERRMLAEEQENDLDAP